MKKQTKIRLFQAAIEPVLLYSCESWSLTKDLTRKLVGCYTKMLRMVQNVSWKQLLTNQELYGNLPPITSKIKQRRLRLAGHCVRHKEEVASELILWETKSSKASRGRRRHTVIDSLITDTGLRSSNEIKTLMKDRAAWSGIVHSVRDRTRPR